MAGWRDVRSKQAGVILGFALAGWAICDTTVVVGMSVTTIGTALLVHAIVAPVAFGLLSYLYFSRFNFTGPLTTALAFLGIVVFMDSTLVAGVINRSYAMFASPIGTWIPMTLIFLSSYLMGVWCQRTGRVAAVRKLPAAAGSATNVSLGRTTAPIRHPFERHREVAGPQLRPGVRARTPSKTAAPAPDASHPHHRTAS